MNKRNQIPSQCSKPKTLEAAIMWHMVIVLRDWDIKIFLLFSFFKRKLNAKKNVNTMHRIQIKTWKSGNAKVDVLIGTSAYMP